MLTTYHSNRLESLAVVLAELMRGRPLPPLQAETVVVPHRSMGHWLSMELAHHHGVAANVDTPLLGGLAWRLLQSHWPALPDQSPFDRAALRWRILDCLPAALERPGFEPLKGYLADGSRERGVKAYQLAERLAGLYDQYLVYRPEWILDWEAGGQDHWQAALWRTLVADSGAPPPHRAALLQTYLRALDDGTVPADALPERISVFGLASAPPVYLELLGRLAEHLAVDVYVLNPSLHYWGDVVSERGLAKLKTVWREHGLPDASDYYTVGHPLLGSLGKTGREFLELLQGRSGDDALAFDTSVEDGATVLAALQADMLFLRNRGTDAETPVRTVPPGDRSIQLHACHSPMREVQVLHDQLRRLFAETRLRPRDVVVMMPDIDRYAPYIEAVFGNAAGARYIPWSITDRSLPGAHPIIQVFSRLLALPGSRLTVSEVLSILEVPAVHRRLGLDADAVERIRGWVREAGVRWAADGEQRAASGLPAWDTHTWRFGLRRLMLGYAMDDTVELYRDMAPLHQVEGGSAAALGALEAFFDDLLGFQRDMAREHTPAQWQRLFNELIDGFFRVEDTAEELALQSVREAVDQMADSASAAGFEQPLPLETVRASLLDTLNGEGVSGGYLTGQVTFCAMVPMRSVPFEVVCLIGLNDRDFPRQSPAMAFDLMADDRRPGDRSLREDDRFLFLEALLSARRMFYMSYVGRDIRDNSVKLPSVAVSELLDTLDRGFATDDGEPLGRLLLTVHPLQPFSRQYRGDDSGAVFSYADDWLMGADDDGIAPGGAPAREQDGDTAARFVVEGLPPPEDELRTVELEELIRFYRNPAEAFLRLRLGTRLQRETVGEEDSEPFTLDALSRYHVEDWLLQQRLSGRPMAELEDYVAAAGWLPEGPFREAALAEVHAEVEDFREAVASQRPEPGEPLEVDLALDGFRLTGWLADLGDQRLLSYRPTRTKGKDLVRLWLTHLAANAAAGTAVTSAHVGRDGTWTLEPVAGESARDQLAVLLGHYWRGLQAPLAFFPESSFAYAEKQFLDKGDYAAERAAAYKWEGNTFQGIPGERDDPSIAVAFRGEEPLDDDDFARLAMAVFEPMLDSRRVE